MLNYKIYTKNIINSIEKIERTCKNEVGLSDIDILDMTLTRLQTIGENSVKIPKEIRQKHKEIKWQNIRKLRNVISHRYETVEIALIWKFIKDKMPLLKETILKIDKELN